jgi:putative SOS response-associated peptidase YedK
MLFSSQSLRANIPCRTTGPPVTNIRNTSSPHWRVWLKPENRYLVPFTASVK